MPRDRAWFAEPDLASARSWSETLDRIAPAPDRPATSKPRRRRRYTIDDAFAALAGLALGVAGIVGWWIVFDRLLSACGAGIGGTR